MIHQKTRFLSILLTLLFIVAMLPHTTPATQSAGIESGFAPLGAGFEHTCAITNDGKVECWGKNNRGQRGDGSNDHSSTPVQVLSDSDATPPEPLTGATAIVADRDITVPSLMVRSGAGAIIRLASWDWLDLTTNRRQWQ